MDGKIWALVAEFAAIKQITLEELKPLIKSWQWLLSYDIKLLDLIR